MRLILPYSPIKITVVKRAAGPDILQSIFGLRLKMVIFYMQYGEVSRGLEK